MHEHLITVCRLFLRAIPKHAKEENTTLTLTGMNIVSGGTIPHIFKFATGIKCHAQVFDLIKPISY